MLYTCPLCRYNTEVGIVSIPYVLKLLTHYLAPIGLKLNVVALTQNEYIARLASGNLFDDSTLIPANEILLKEGEGEGTEEETTALAPLALALSPM